MKGQGQLGDIIVGFIRRLFNIDPAPDPVVEVLRSLLEAEKFKNEKLLQQILDLTAPKVQPVVREEQKIAQPVRTSNFVPWSVKRQLLEAEDRATAKTLREKQEADAKIKSVEELEKELGVSDAL